ncbi:MAG: hypothetical protein CVU39_20845 [Chloroflexi bacterium HGW-Chloroflexi-10]|nr:MAG: hypothetical protein CVU39_20845 [Chloroflexi bacterium HGW-Chloroflexi-10]
MQRWNTENSLLPLLQGKLPVPTLLPNNTDGEILLKAVAGLHAQDVINNDSQANILLGLGRLLQQIQSLSVEPFQGLLTGNGTVLVHGDFGPQNLLVNQKSYQPALLFDWEWAHLGDPVEDAAWCEWIVRMFHQPAAKDLPRFYEAYGQLPAWSDRHESMQMTCRRHLDFARLMGRRKTIQQWQNRVVYTRRLTSF